MRRVGSVGGTASRTGPVRTASGAGGFSVGAAPERAATAALGAAGGIAATALAALQEDPRAVAARRDAAARRRGGAMLEELAGLQREMLGGTVDQARLERLAALGDGEEAADPGLREAVRAVAVRAAVELARRGISPSS